MTSLCSSCVPVDHTLDQVSFLSFLVLALCERRLRLVLALTTLAVHRSMFVLVIIDRGLGLLLYSLRGEAQRREISREICSYLFPVFNCNSTLHSTSSMSARQANSRERLQQAIDARIRSLGASGDSESVRELKLRRNALSPIAFYLPKSSQSYSSCRALHEMVD